ncbi:hypothetical protein LCGC14_2553960, partial [marine sediment metagenome]
AFLCCVLVRNGHQKHYGGTTMNVILIVPTGLGAPIGGHAGDATPVARLIAPICNRLIVHPNIVNASDINEIPGNALYVMGATIDDLLSGYVGINEVRRNRIAVLVNRPIPNEIINIVSAARVTLGIEAFIVGLSTNLRMVADFALDGSATGTIEGAQEAAEYLQSVDKPFDAVAILSKIEMPTEVAETYIREKGVNPWGGVEAKLTRIMTDILKVPCAHAPVGHTLDDFNDVVDPRIAAELVSVTYAFCVLKGLHKAPEITDGSYGIVADDIDVLVSPVNCFGIPHKKCVERDIPIITVMENDPIVKNLHQFPQHKVANYMEAAGLLIALREGISFDALRRPISATEVIDYHLDS